MKVAVVGAGLAGLATADALAAAGVEVVVLEARDRVGGRVWSRTLPNGATIELGAEFVLPGNDALRALVGRFDLGLWDKGMRYGVREPRGGIGTELGRVGASVARVLEALPDGDEPVGASARSFLDQLTLDPGAREAIEARLEVSCADTADRIDAGELRGVAAHGDDPCPSVAGGNQRLALELARGLGEAVQLDSPIEAVVQAREGVAVSGPGTELVVDRVVLGVPASVIERIGFEPALPTRLAAAYAAVRYGHAAKLFVPLIGPAQPSAVLSVPERYWTWTATAGEEVQPVVNAFAGSAPALERLEVDAGPGRWLESLARLRPELALQPEGAVLSTWDDDPWVRAAYSSVVPEVAAWVSTGPIHACGEHTAGPHAALMEGALRSGVRAAGEILASSR